MTAVSSAPPPFSLEFVIVDNGSTDSTFEVIERFKKKQKWPVFYVQVFKPGLARARNAGVGHSSGEVVAFTDDDCLLCDNFWEEIANIFRSHRIDYYGGRVLLYEKSDAPLSIKTESEVSLLEPHSFVPAGFLHGANMGFRREVFDKVGLFDELLGAGSALKAGEDTEFIERASFAGFRGGYFPGPTVYHQHGRKLANEVEEIKRGYDLGRGACFIKRILQPGISKKRALRYWYWHLKQMPMGAKVREVQGALLYLSRSFIQASGRDQLWRSGR